MIQVEDKIISLDIFEKHFVCDLNACKGACCIEGDAGAPLSHEEEKILGKIYEKVKPYMREEGIIEIENQGVAVYDEEGDLTTPLVNNKECAFVIFENGITKCTIEKAYNDGIIDFKKPISCHLFPIRIKEYRDFDAVNYEEIKICKPACECGSKLEVPVYVFLKESLIRKYGEDWYKELLEAAQLLKK
ncbi:MAG: hypothetical protein CMD22_04910 [Flavobacteriales bacterium]|nr:hypothetical protein [Flavobacteriales bacterium]|tara:strand:+ start:2625 stop:3191 length:567 start_codon:yes stop_codon:yes gene_type:complete